MKKKHKPPNAKWVDILKEISQKKKSVCTVNLKLLDIIYQGNTKQTSLEIHQLGILEIQ